MSVSSLSPLVSVVIPNHNYGTYLRTAIESVLAQTYPHREILVVDDGSTDDSEAVLREYDGRVRWFRQQQQGVSVARNHGVRESRGALVAFLDPDDAWLPSKLERQVARWCREPDLGLVHCGVQMIDARGETLEVRLDGREGWLATEMLLFEQTTVLMAGSSALIPRPSFEAVGGFDPRLSTSADWDLCYRIARRQRVGFIPDALIRVRVHGANMHANIALMEHDMFLAYGKAFTDPRPEIHAIRRRSYGNLHMVLAGCFFRAGQPVKCAEHLLKGLWLTPHNVRRVLGFPIRWWTRRSNRPPAAQPMAS